MPELPEVETIVRDLRPRVLGRRFVDAEFYWPRLVQNLPPEEFRRKIVGAEVGALERRGKYMVFHLPRERLVMHLMMSGSLCLQPVNADPKKYLSAHFYLDDGYRLAFSDSRKLGRVWLVESEAEVLNGMGPEPLMEGFTAEYLMERLKGRKAPVKPLLLDQSTVAGLGNIYVDESLYTARIRPDRLAGELAAAEVHRLWGGVREVLRQGVENRGTSFKDYRDGFGKPGDNQNALKVFRREGHPCPSCGDPIVRVVLRGRSTFFCPKCQR